MTFIGHQVEISGELPELQIQIWESVEKEAEESSIVRANTVSIRLRSKTSRDWLDVPCV